MSTAAVHKLTSAEEKPAAPALGFSIQVDLGAGRNAVLQTHLPNDASLDDINAMLDKMSSAADRQKARYDIDALTRTLEADEKMLAQAREDEERCRRDWEAQQALREKDLKRAQEDYDTSFNEAYERHRGSGRRGEFTASAQIRSKGSALARAKEDFEKEKIKHEAEVGNFHTTVVRWESEIAKKRAEIASLQEKVGP